MVKGCVKNAANPAVKATRCNVIRVYFHAKGPKMGGFIKAIFMVNIFSYYSGCPVQDSNFMVNDLEYCKNRMNSVFDSESKPFRKP